ncbi:hypothetical protein IC619_003640 [Hazenella sp. IB182353]|uniref:hypothetical protein n=1 Tax=Polycladospora coralii TaxID=2771432 RepID=UPI0017469E45|nr:hypothetical protein [Polycladospora coralii]MBS7529589.1 hypothetical protein [Polycladospora coralii]
MKRIIGIIALLVLISGGIYWYLSMDKPKISDTKKEDESLVTEITLVFKTLDGKRTGANFNLKWGDKDSWRNETAPYPGDEFKDQDGKYTTLFSDRLDLIVYYRGQEYQYNFEGNGKSLYKEIILPHTSLWSHVKTEPEKKITTKKEVIQLADYPLKQKEQPFCDPNACEEIGNKMLTKIKKKHGNILDVYTSYSSNKEYKQLGMYEIENLALVPEPLDIDQNDDWQQVKDPPQKIEQLWNFWNSIIPEKHAHKLDNLYFFAYEDYLTELNYDQYGWGLGMNISPSFNKKAYINSFIYQLGEIISSYEDSIEYVATDNCKNYYYRYWSGCSYEDSYINQFYQAYWKDIEKPWSFLDTINNTEHRLQFYKNHQSEFLNEFATQDAVSDMMESFSYFIFNPPPKELNKISNQKIAFFYQYPELVELRAEILTNIDENL